MGASPHSHCNPGSYSHGRDISRAELDPPAVGVQPQADQQLRVGVLASGVPFDRRNLGVIGAQVQPPHQFPNQARAVVLPDQPIDIHTVQN
jgi:hypothetical protein